MAELPFHLRYSLSRSQRLAPLLRMNGAAFTWCSGLFLTCMLIFFEWQTVEHAWTLDWCGVAVFGGLAACVLFNFSSLGLLQILVRRVQNMDIIVDENTAQMLIGNERWVLFLDGINNIRKYADDIWTIEHRNGTILHVPASAITDNQIEHLRAAMARGRTPEGIRAVIERGKRILELEKQLRMKRYP